MKVFIKNLPPDADEDELRRLFLPFGDIASVYLGPALSNVDFLTLDAARAAIAAWHGLSREMHSKHATPPDSRLSAPRIRKDMSGQIAPS